MFLTTESVFKPQATDVIKPISTAADGAQGNDDSSNAQISADGRYVVFQSDASNLVADDTNNAQDIFRKDLVTGQIERISAAGTRDAPIQANGLSSFAQISTDGRYVIFTSTASNLVANDTNNAEDVFRKDLVTGRIDRVTITVDGAQANGRSNGYHISADGRYVLFESNATNLVTGDTNSEWDVFRKDLVTGEIVRLSTAADGAQASDGGDTPQLSTDGRYLVLTSSSSNLVAGKTNGTAEDIYLVDLFYKAHGPAIAEGRFIEVKLGTGAASSATIAWGDGTSSTVTPSAGSAAFNHVYASTGAKAATITLVEGALTWNVAHTIDLASGTMVRNTALTDTLSGGAGSDILTGDAFANHLIANAGNDRLNGGTGNDLLEGGAGNDVFSAGDGNDRLVGGLGRDTLTGNTGRDVFVFDDRETGSSKSKADTITDFRGRSGDRIDLKLVDANSRLRGDQKFSFIGDDEAFTRAGQVRYEKTKGTTYVYLNTDSDRAAEAVIKLKGAMDLSKGWFVL